MTCAPNDFKLGAFTAYVRYLGKYAMHIDVRQTPVFAAQFMQDVREELAYSIPQVGIFLALYIFKSSA